MCRFTHFAAAYLRIILRKIIKYAAIMINPADCWNTEHGRREFTEARWFSRTVRSDIIGKGNGHFGSRDSTRVMRSGYQNKVQQTHGDYQIKHRLSN
jgi:hypothetical protein